MGLSNQTYYGARISVEVEVDDTCVVCCSISAEADDGIPTWAYRELLKAAQEIKQKLADGWDGTEESDTAEDEASVGTASDADAK